MPRWSNLFIGTQYTARLQRHLRPIPHNIGYRHQQNDTDEADDKRTIIIEYIRRNGEAKTEDLVKLLGSSTTRTKVLIYQLVDEGVLVSCGGNRNRTYKLRE